MRLTPPFALLSAVLLVACGAANGSGGVPVQVSPPTGALSAWATFPVEQTPRPVVLIANLSPTGGFGSGDAKIAALCHKFTSQIQLPTVVPRETKVAWSIGTKGTYPAVSAAAALTAMTQP